MKRKDSNDHPTGTNSTRPTAIGRLTKYERASKGPRAPQLGSLSLSKDLSATPKSFQSKRTFLVCSSCESSHCSTISLRSAMSSPSESASSGIAKGLIEQATSKSCSWTCCLRRHMSQRCVLGPALLSDSQGP
eukprot:UN4739